MVKKSVFFEIVNNTPKNYQYCMLIFHVLIINFALIYKGLHKNLSIICKSEVQLT